MCNGDAQEWTQERRIDHVESCSKLNAMMQELFLGFYLHILNLSGMLAS